ncbi:MAG: FtsW/RodA/SpoVE family cell cycle protein [Candidatus Kaiserbacteria bacterium]|nr:FtsW/RodA/SpoVE family cell cycle protein [Candidatus Kaiserbacteria bacterium]
MFKKYIRRRDQLEQMIWISVFTLFFLGIIFLFYAYISEATKDTSVDVFRELGTQIVAFGVGIAVMYGVAQLRYYVLARHIAVISAISVLAMTLLITPLAIARNSAVRWVDLGFTQFQPSEVMKLGIVLFFAFVFTRPSVREHLSKMLLYSFGAFSFLAATAYLQPDYGTVLIVGSAVISMALVSKLPRMWWVVMFVAGTLATTTLFVVAPTYLENRFHVFYNVNFGEVSPTQRYGEAYHTLQNLEAVQTGGLFGQGLGHVSQNVSLSVPEITTDSIFALVAAEVGFLGSIFIILCFLFLLYLFYALADITKEPFGKCVVVGIATLLAAQFFVNILVVLGFPATGIPLPFFSRGGSSIVITLLSVGIVLSVLRQQIIRQDVYRGPLV